MLVYGDQQEEIAPALLYARLARDNGRHLSHDALRSRFLKLAALTQAVADADFHSCGCDRQRPAEEALLDHLVAHGRALLASFDRDCAGGEAPPLTDPPALPASAVARVPEGYAFYALYPEAFGLAARQLMLKGEPRVIGLRSIGTGLAAMAAAALGAPRPITLRPAGDPFARSLRLAPSLAAELAGADVHQVVVDEGPGLSGSSFGCVADWLEDRGVARERIAFLPGHSGELGGQAAERHRARWKQAQRPVVQLDCLPRWFAQLVGPIRRWDDLSAGKWRTLWSASERDWPAVTPQWERAKYRLRTDSGWWLARFAGLGAAGEDKLASAKLLHRAGFGAEVAGLAHGWLLQRWHEDARPCRPTLDELAAYLRLRSFLPARQGASLSELGRMVRRNAPWLQSWAPDIARLQQRVRPVRVDGRMQAHEWLRLEDGRLLKADALDHHQAHDLVGCQDLAWDVAGAAIELGLGREDVRLLELALGVDPDLTSFYRTAYAAFRYGAHRMSEDMAGAAEQERHRRAAGFYRSALVDAVEHPGDVDQPLGLGVEALA
jgi:hypothetical protein